MINRIKEERGAEFRAWRPVGILDGKVALASLEGLQIDLAD
jgi:hypothetical protein